MSISHDVLKIIPFSMAKKKKKKITITLFLQTYHQTGKVEFNRQASGLMRSSAMTEWYF